MTDDEIREQARAAHERIKHHVRTAPELSYDLLERIRHLLPPLPPGLEVESEEEGADEMCRRTA